LNDECRIEVNGSVLSYFGIRSSHFATVAERAFVAEWLAREIAKLPSHGATAGKPSFDVPALEMTLGKTFSMRAK